MTPPDARTLYVPYNKRHPSIFIYEPLSTIGDDPMSKYGFTLLDRSMVDLTGLIPFPPRQGARPGKANELGFWTRNASRRPEVGYDRGTIDALVKELQRLDARNISRDRIFDRRDLQVDYVVVRVPETRYLPAFDTFRPTKVTIL